MSIFSSSSLSSFIRSNDDIKNKHVQWEHNVTGHQGKLHSTKSCLKHITMQRSNQLNSRYSEKLWELIEHSNFTKDELGLLWRENNWAVVIETKTDYSKLDRAVVWGWFYGFKLPPPKLWRKIFIQNAVKYAPKCTISKQKFQKCPTPARGVAFGHSFVCPHINPRMKFLAKAPKLNAVHFLTASLPERRI